MNRFTSLLLFLILIILVGCNDNITKNLNLIKSDLEKDEIKISRDVKLSVSIDDQRIMHMTFTNNSDQNIDYGMMLFLEKKIEGNWFRLIEKAGFADEGYVLEPHMESFQEVELDNWEETSSGTFRVYKTYSTDPKRPATETEKISLSNEFSVGK